MLDLVEQDFVNISNVTGNYLKREFNVLEIPLPQMFVRIQLSCHLRCQASMYGLMQVMLRICLKG